jgi:hypothetical protein
LWEAFISQISITIVASNGKIRHIVDITCMIVLIDFFALAVRVVLTRHVESDQGQMCNLAPS